MKVQYTFLFTFISSLIFSQVENFDTLLAKGKAEFKKEFEKQDYAVAAESLEKAVQLKPSSTEAHYYLGYAYSRMNSKDGKSMISETSSLTRKASEQFELVNKLEKKYSGETVILDPYSKLTSDWGSLAMSYWHNNKPDSAVWAFKEGKKRGGFGEFYLSLNKAVLNLCTENSILMSSGDNFTIPLWYLQIAEGYRKDVSVIDVSLLNTTWYPQFLSAKGVVQFDLPKADLDTVEYCKWNDSVITIADFSWTLKPTYYNEYLLRGDRVFLSLLKENKFRRPVYFTTAFMEDSRLSLKDYLVHFILVDQLNINNTPLLNDKQYQEEITKVLVLVKKINKNSQQELNFIDNIRYDIFDRATISLEQNNRKQVRELFRLLDDYAGEKAYPYQDPNGKRYETYLRDQF